MTSDQKFFAIMTLCVAFFGIFSALFGLLWRAARLWQSTLDQIRATNIHIEQLVIAGAEEHARLRDATKDVARSVARHVRQHERKERDAIQD